MAPSEVFTGANGSLLLAPDDTLEGADAKTVVDAYEMQTVGRLTDVTLRVNTALKEFHEVGRRHPVSLSPGNIYISGSVGRAYVNGGLLTLLLGKGAKSVTVPEPYVQPTFTLVVSLLNPAKPEEPVALSVGGVKFENWQFAVPEDEFVMENLCFKGLTMSVLDAGVEIF
ncbi:hypothetical protein [Amycolatopsis nigrescens]|uniref:hypothetical protein n=1 Tax=Amycolatopsis nigrescens TaxID=381445 RepID=UPI000376601B|nr:hypothetical protein [Amycolatopsis nigrescens]